MYGGRYYRSRNRVTQALGTWIHAMQLVLVGVDRHISTSERTTFGTLRLLRGTRQVSHQCCKYIRQAAFRGYRLRERLRRLPAREAEKQIKALHRNARGFRRVGLFLVFIGLYFALVFYGVDVSFQRSVQQSLKDHLKLVSRGGGAEDHSLQPRS